MGFKCKNAVKKEFIVRTNCMIGGLPVQWFFSWKDKGLVRSNIDAVRQVFRCFEEELGAKNHVHVLSNGAAD